MTQHKFCDTYWVKIYASGPIDIAKQIIRKECFEEGLCVTIEPTTFIYTGGEEFGYVVGLINYPRFPKTNADVLERGKILAYRLLDCTYQKSILIMSPDKTERVSTVND